MPEVWATREVIVALITTFGVISTAGLSVIAVLLQRARTHVKAARDQVENNHETNLRDDIDGKHDTEMDVLKMLSRDVGGIKSDLRLLRQTDTRHSDRLWELEHPERNRK